MKISLMQRYRFNESKPIVQILGSEDMVQWDNCDLSDCPPFQQPGSMTAHGKINIVNHDELPETFTDTDGNEHKVEDIIAYRSSR